MANLIFSSASREAFWADRNADSTAQHPPIPSREAMSLDIAKLSKEEIAKISPEDIAKMSLEDLAKIAGSLEPEWCGFWNGYGYSGISASD